MTVQSSELQPSRRAARVRPLTFVNGDKGGVGKSWLARIIAWQMLLDGVPVEGIDGDPRNAHLRRYYGGSFTVHRPYLRSEQGWSELIDTVASAADDTAILIDLPAGAGDDLETQMRRLVRGLPADRPVVHIWVACEEEDSITLFDRVRWLAKAPSTAFVMNGRFGSPETFELWRNSRLREEHLRDGGLEAYINPLRVGIRTKFARARAPFHAVEELDLLRSERTDFELWTEDMQAALQAIFDLVRG